MIKTQEDFFKQICTSHFIARVRKGLLKVCMWEGAGDWTELKYFDPKLMAVSVVFLVLQGCSTGGPGLTLLGDLLHLISSFPGPQLHRGSRGAPSAGCGFPYHISSLFISNATGTPTGLTSVLTELYNSSTPPWSPTRLPTRSLKSHV